MSKERRIHSRAKRVLSIQYRIHKTTRKSLNKEWHLSTTEDMSVGGLAFYTAEEYKIGEVLQIRVTMSGILDIFDGFGKVIRARKKKTGAYFLTAVRMVDKPTVRRSAKTYTTKRKSVVKKKAKKRI